MLADLELEMLTPGLQVLDLVSKLHHCKEVARIGKLLLLRNTALQVIKELLHRF